MAKPSAPADLTETQRENLEIARRLVELYESGGPWKVHERFDEFFHPDFEWRPAVVSMGERIFVGRDGFSSWQEDMDTIAQEARQTEFELTALDDRVVLVLSKMAIVGKGSGASFESEYGAVYEMEDGRGVVGQAFLSHAEAVRAAEEAAGGGGGS
jgi:ketosteroid isomerase-like protein